MYLECIEGNIHIPLHFYDVKVYEYTILYDKKA